MLSANEALHFAEPFARQSLLTTNVLGSIDWDDVGEYSVDFQKELDRDPILNIMQDLTETYSSAFEAFAEAEIGYRILEPTWSTTGWALEKRNNIFPIATVDSICEHAATWRLGEIAGAVKRMLSSIGPVLEGYGGYESSRVAKEIVGFGDLPTDWAGDGSVPPSPETIRDALRFLSLLPVDAPQPEAAPAADGEIILEWFSPEKKLVVSLIGDGRFAYAMLHGDRFEPGAHEGMLSSAALPDDLREYLLRL